MNHNIMKTNTFESILLERARGSWIWDTKGRKILDCESGMWCVNLGHNHPAVNQALKDQMDKLIHRNKGFLTPITIDAAEKLLNFVPGNFDALTFLNSGTEAVEFGINFSKKVTGRDMVISLQNSYLGAYGVAKKSSYTSKVKSRTEYALPHHICDENRCGCVEKYGPILERLFDRSYPACFILEPIIVSGGVFRPCKNLVEYICSKIHEFRGLVVVDEVTTGIGRTGKKFGFEHFNIDPDVLVLGKGLGNGYPVSAVITKSDLESELTKEELYYVQSHQLDPLGATAAHAVIDIFEKEDVLRQTIENGHNIKRILDNLSSKLVRETRSYGMIFGIELNSTHHKIDHQIIVELKDTFLSKGVLLGFNTSKNLLRMLPPLNINSEAIDFLSKKLNEVFAEYTRQ